MRTRLRHQPDPRQPALRLHRRGSPGGRARNAQPGGLGPDCRNQRSVSLFLGDDVLNENVGGIYLNTVGDTSGGTKLVPITTTTAEMVHDIEWLPDGSGFLFSMRYGRPLGHMLRHLRVQLRDATDHSVDPLPAGRKQRRRRARAQHLARRPANRLRARRLPIRYDEQPVDHEPRRLGPAQTRRRCRSSCLGSDPSASHAPRLPTDGGAVKWGGLSALADLWPSQRRDMFFCKSWAVSHDSVG